MTDHIDPVSLPEGPARTMATLAVQSGLRVVDAIVEPLRAAVHGTAPPRHRKGAAGRYLKAKLGPDGRPFRHQATALGALADERNVVVTTPTSSGKSLIFQAHAMNVAEKGGKVIVLYPVKALATDQMRSWRQATDAAGLPADWVGEITGSVPGALRKDVLEKARIVAMTPDVLHSWMMRKLDDKEIRSFLAETRLVVLDEAHVLDGAFGSSVALLLRRLQVACDICRVKRKEEPLPITYFASSATIADPVGHLRRLTGREFLHVPDSEDGSPRHGRVTLHLEPPASDDDALTRLQRAIGDRGGHPFITFCDSRKNVEILTKAADDRKVLPYRGGYETEDRKRIEDGLRAGRLKGVISTSALEMGIDMGRLGFGMNLGLRASRRSIRQRIGRVGRSGAGAFAVVASAEEFKDNGGSFREYVTGPVEPSNLYLDNPYLQFQHATCLHAELAALGVRNARRPPPLGTGDWPEGFSEAFSASAPGKQAPARYADVAKLNKGLPHLDFTLRSIGEKSLEIVDVAGKRIGSIERRAALSEAYPEGTYLHMGRSYTVAAWKPGPFGQPQVVVRAGQSSMTKPLQRTLVTASLEGDGIIDGRRLGNDACTEARLQVKESVLGFTRKGARGGTSNVVYGVNSGSSAKHRNVRTTGVVLRLPFLEARRDAKAALVEALVRRFRRNYGIDPAEIGYATEAITLKRGSLMERADDAIVVYDNVHGSLRLTSRLYDEIPELGRTLLSSPNGWILDRTDVRAMENWLSSLREVRAGDLFEIPDHFQGVEALPPGTAALRRRKDQADQAITLSEPLLVRRRGEVELCYHYSSDLGDGLVPEDQVAFDGPSPSKRAWSHEVGFEPSEPVLRVA